MNRIFSIGSILAAVFLACGCAVGPNYAPPVTQTPAAWTIDQEGGITAQPLEVVTWWELLSDSMLNSLIQRAVEANYDLRIAQARVREARAQRAVVAGGRWPEVDAFGSYTRSRRSENSFGGGGEFGPQGQDVDLFQTGFDAAWELDVFGRVRRSVEAADAEFGAAIEDRRDVLVTLLAEVARNYVETRDAQRRLEIANNNIESQRETLQISEARYNAGLVSELDVAQARAQLATTRSQVPVLETALRQSMYALAVLLAREPGALIDELAAPGPIPSSPAQVPVGLPSDLLRRRPDIRAAERQLAAATARIGVATADLFPRFLLTGSISLAAEDAALLFNGSSLAYSFGPSVSWPVFAGGSIRANIQVQNAVQEQALAQYERTVLLSLADVENSLVAFWKQQSRREALTEAVAANRRAVELANELYSRGVGDFLNVLESQRSLYLVEDQLAQSERDVTSAYIALYKALGGGWQVFEAQPQPTTAPEGAPADEVASAAQH